MSLAAGAVAAVCPLCRVQAAQRVRMSGTLCTAYARLDDVTVTIEASTGDQTLDQQLMLEADRLSRLFGVTPGLKIMVHPPSYSGNAVAWRKTIVDGTTGTVMLGRDLVFDELKRNLHGWGGLVVAGLMAHEFAHIYQFNSGYRERLAALSNTVEPIELHADFLAGYHLGLKRRGGADMDIRAFMDGIYFMGDRRQDLGQHHGHCDERRRAVRQGYRVGIEGTGPIAAAADIGETRVKALLADPGLANCRWK